MKQCNKCNETKDLDQFYRDRKSRDNLQHSCKVCSLARMKAYAQTVDLKPYRKAYFKTEAGRKARARAVRVQRAKFPWKRKARAKVNNAIASGKMKKASSRSCAMESGDCEGPKHYHHSSYREEDWLKVEVMCRKHHMDWHRENETKPYTEKKIMSDVRELARECVRLWPSEFVKSKGSALAECMRLDRHGLPVQHVEYFVGPIRHAVEVECERRGWSCGWHSRGFQAPLLGHTFFALEWFGDNESEERVDIQSPSSALECALLALKWLLENPQEEA